MPRTRNSIRDTIAKNVSNSNITTKEIQPKKKTRANGDIDRNAQPKVLRDITDEYLASPAPQTKLKRNPQAPTRSTVSVTAAPKSNAFESSLPPSSPPSTSSQVPVATSYSYPEINTLPSNPIGADLNATDDPFGFFAVEEKLKANRRTRAPTTQRTLRVASSDSIEENADESMQQAFATPKPTNPLRTPRKRTNAKKRKLELSTHSSSSCVGAEDREEEGESMPSTPSPVKAENRSVEVDGDEARNAMADGKGKEEAVQRGRKEDKATKAEADMNPMELARHLEALLPRRPKPQADVRRGARSKKVPVKSVDEGGKKQRNWKGNKGKTEGGSKRKVKQETEDEDEDEGGGEEEQRLRQVRIDYFKKLDGYEVQKEDVYIV